MNGTHDELRFDLSAARQTVSDFSVATGINCRLLDAEGRTLFNCIREDVCAALSKAVGPGVDCDAIHAGVPEQAERFGGRYIYSCPMGFGFFASPIMNGGELAGAIVAGPVLLTDAEDQLSAAAVPMDTLEQPSASAALAAARAAPRCSPEQLQSLSRLLFAGSVYISDDNYVLLRSYYDREHSEVIGDYISYLKDSEGERVPYPLDKERELFRAVSLGDAETADTLLNQLLGHIYFYAIDSEEVLIRIEELFVVLMRAAACGGADTGHILALSRRYLWEIRHMRSQEELTGWLATSLRHLTNQAFQLVEVKHAGAMQKALDYMKRRCTGRLTLEETAEYVGYSPAYFSRIFREDTGETFKEYLNELRIEKSRLLLLTTDLTISEISAMLGYNDQSYFCKCFRRVTGVTPDRYRKRSRRIDYEKEYGGGSGA